MFKVFIIAVLAVILWSLGSALYQMARKKGDSKTMARALTLRIALSVGLFLVIVVALVNGWIQPRNL